MTRIAVVDKRKCNPSACGNYLCIRICPVNRTGSECIIKDQDKKILIQEELCTGCNLCSNRCPCDAIKIVNLPEALKEDPIHRYGKNQFELFRLPIPKKNTIVGLLGRNGIGKTTSMAILSGSLIPNLGILGQEDKDKVIEKYKNTILGDYFKNLYNNKIKVSYKPQRVELIPQLYKGKVYDLLKKVDEKNIAKELLKELGISHLINRQLSELSGGELQKIAIIATFCKKADFYFFDEPASFLDINSRIKVAKILRRLKDSSVMIVEHDLATLDYISDEIQILYGKQACYGIVSQTKSVRRGINEYLDGYLPDDNVRFRDYKIIFEEKQETKFLQEEILLKIPQLEKNFENFSLKVHEGEIKKQEVLGVMGANALGKTTFLKLLAGIEKPDKGKIEKQQIAFKEQYIKSVEGTVIENLMSVAKSKFSSGWFKHNILEKLNLRSIMNQEVKNLSGGELQKFHIAITLSKDAKI